MFDEILAHMNDYGLVPGDLTLDGKVHRFKVDSTDHKKSGWYIGFQNHASKTGEVFHVVVYGSYRNGETHKYMTSGIKLSPHERKALEEQIEKSKKIADAERAIIQEQTAEEVAKKWDTLSSDGVSEYLNRKQIAECPDLGIRFATKKDGQDDGFFVPMRDLQGKIWSVQRIQNDGGKFFHPAGKVKGLFHVLGKLEDAETIRIAEGFATAASIRIATNEPVVCAFNAGNLVEVACGLRASYPHRPIVLCADDDRWGTRSDGTPYNAGRESSTEAAKAVLGTTVFPEFKTLEEKRTTDFNDLHCREGIDRVRELIVPVRPERLFLVALGFKEKEYFYTSSHNKQIVPISGFKESDFLGLMPIEYWESVFPGRGAQRVDWTQARSSLMEQARERGIFQTRHVRGAGVWSDEGRVVVNMGDHLIVDGTRQELGEIKSRYFYTLGAALPGLHKSPLSVHECDVLVRACANFKWLKDDYGFLMAGALVTSRICGALPVRPHTWLTGGAQTGKTTLLERLINPILGESVLYVQGATTEAGVRQSIKADAIPVVFDEFETTGQKSGENIAACIELMRASWSDSSAMIVKGGAMGNASSFQVRFSAIVSSIRTNLQNDADRSRFAILELAPHGSDQNHWKELSSCLAQIDKEYGERLFARVIRMIPTMLLNYKKLKSALAARSSSRFGDQYGMLLAGYSVLLTDEPITDAEAEVIASHVSLDDEREQAKVKDEDDASNQAMTKRISIEVGMSKHEYTIAEAIGLAKTDDRINTALQRIGIRVFSDTVAIACRHTELEAQVFRGTRWSMIWAESLSRIPGAEKSKVVWMAGRSQKCVVIPSERLTK